MVSAVNSRPTITAVRNRPVLLCLSVLALIFAAGPGRAGKYAYGEEFVRVGKNWADAAPVQASPRRAAADSVQDQGEFQQQVARLEDQGGPYSEALVEPLASLGRYHHQSGDLEQATRLYRRALHVVRVNEGLYSERQIPILQELLDIYRVLGELQVLDDRYDYYFRLYGSGQAPYTLVRMHANLAYLRWQREAVRLDVDSDASLRLLALYQLNDELLEAAGADSSVALPRYRDLVFSQLRNLYLLEDRYAPTVETVGISPPLPLLANEWSTEDFNKRRLQTIQRGGLSRGADLLSDLIERTQRDGSTTELARLHLELGDWYQWHGSDHRAGEQYRQVVQLLTEDGQSKLLQQWLGQPVELPDNGAFWQPRPASKAERQVIVNVRYDVSARGRVSNMQASVSDPKDEGQASVLKRKLRQIRFRPRWLSGAAEPVAQIQRDYQLMNWH